MSDQPLATTLASLHPGERALVLGIDADPQFVARMAARGVVPGVEVGVVCAGDPVLLAVDDSRWAVNRQDASRVCVDRLQSPRTGWLRRWFGR